MDRLLIDILIAVAIGLVLGALAHRRAIRQESIHGGLPALALHYLGASAFCSALPGVLLAVFTGMGFLTAVAFGFSCFLIALALLLAHAAVERAPRAAALARQDEGWTAEKAKTSGL